MLGTIDSLDRASGEGQIRTESGTYLFLINDVIQHFTPATGMRVRFDPIPGQQVAINLTQASEAADDTIDDHDLVGELNAAPTPND